MSDDATDHARALFDSLGLDPEEDPELDATPEMFVEFLRENFATREADPPEMSTFPSDYTGSGSPEPVVVADLPFHSMCVHHVVPFFGRIDVAYLPAETMTGFGSVGRVVDHFTSRPQVQERLVEEIAEHLEGQLEPRGVLVRCRARQMCVEMRGNRKRASFLSTASRGELRDGAVRREVISAFDEKGPDD